MNLADFCTHFNCGGERPLRQMAEDLPYTVDSVGIGLIFPGMVLLLRAVLDFKVFEPWKALGFAVMVGGALSAAILAFDPATRRKIPSAILLCLFSLGYGYGLVVEADVRLDRSPGQSYQAAILSKRIAHGKRIEYKVRISPWGRHTKEDDLDVSRSTYEELFVGGTANLG